MSSLSLLLLIFVFVLFVRVCLRFQFSVVFVCAFVVCNNVKANNKHIFLDSFRYVYVCRPSPLVCLHFVVDVFVVMCVFVYFRVCVVVVVFCVLLMWLFFVFDSFAQIIF